MSFMWLIFICLPIIAKTALITGAVFEDEEVSYEQ